MFSLERSKLLYFAHAKVKDAPEASADWLGPRRRRPATN
jgi:hypothetical protein